VVESAGLDYEIASEPDDVFLANVRFLAGYRRDWLFDRTLLDEIYCVAARNTEISIAKIVAELGKPKQAVLPGIFHLMWQHRFEADLTRVLGNASTVEAQQ
jgi:hypothetical protein